MPGREYNFVLRGMENMVTAGEFRNGITFEMDGSVFQIIEFQHVKPGKGAAFVRTKIRNVITGATVERSFNPTDKFERAQINKRDMQYLYKDGDLYYFMDEETFEQNPINGSSLGDAMEFVKENMTCKILFFKEQVIGIEPPIFVELEITETEPGFKGDTATGATKPAIVETGAQIKVPLFVNQGDVVRIDTRTGEYMERV
jgi:elongation factor P